MNFFWEYLKHILQNKNAGQNFQQCNYLHSVVKAAERPPIGWLHPPALKVEWPPKAPN